MTNFIHVYCTFVYICTSCKGDKAIQCSCYCWWWWHNLWTYVHVSIEHNCLCNAVNDLHKHGGTAQHIPDWYSTEGNRQEFLSASATCDLSRKWLNKILITLLAAGHTHGWSGRAKGHYALTHNQCINTSDKGEVGKISVAKWCNRTWLHKERTSKMEATANIA